MTSAAGARTTRSPASCAELADATPTLLVLDDLHNAGLGTIELLHFVIRQIAGARLLVVATVRTEEAAAVTARRSTPSPTCIEVGPLTGAAVARLADEAGHADMADGILARTRGHTLFVVETLRALTARRLRPAGAIPESLQAAVLARVRRTGDAVAEAAAGGGGARRRRSSRTRWPGCSTCRRRWRWPSASRRWRRGC